MGPLLAQCPAAAVETRTGDANHRGGGCVSQLAVSLGSDGVLREDSRVTNNPCCEFCSARPAACVPEVTGTWLWLKSTHLERSVPMSRS